MSNESASSRLSLARKLGLVVLGLVALLAIAALIVSLMGRARLDSAIDAWAAAGLGLEDSIAERPAQEANAAALEIEGLARAVGIEIVPKSTDRYLSPAPDPESAASVKAAYSAAADWLKVVLTAEDDEQVPEAPEALPSWFEANADAWTALRARLAEGEELRWERDPSKGLEVPVPNLLGYIRVGRLLVADALIASRAGRHEQAAQALEASWTLTTSLRERDSLISHLIRIALAKQQAGVLRRLPRVDEALWIARLQDRSLLQDLGVTLRNEAAAYATVFSSDDAKGSDPFGHEGHVLRMASPELLGRHAMGTYLEEMLSVTRAIAANPNCPAIDAAEAATRAFEQARNPMVDMISLDTRGLIARAFTAQVLDELTVKVLDARRSGGVAGPQWARSRCESMSYELTSLPDGGFRVSIVGDVASAMQAAQESTVPLLALSHVEPAS